MSVCIKGRELWRWDAIRADGALPGPHLGPGPLSVPFQGTYCYSCNLSQAASSGRKRMPLSETCCPTARNLSGSLVHTWTCSKCGHRTRPKEPFSCLSLQMPTQGTVNLQSDISAQVHTSSLCNEATTHQGYYSCYQK
ncbi:hypothetical protein Vretifemale_18111 [Volvox reticuliferus]|uniref:Uncharacterized protein n=1 Tax=Volvox reticuliferus TaxID=1737510 RepID=A0A8J4FXB0_9CHLO|nr:hypothetical protein Vretifemale_18111 [Volvox reticuliferus]